MCLQICNHRHWSVRWLHSPNWYQCKHDDNLGNLSKRVIKLQVAVQQLFVAHPPGLGYLFVLQWVIKKFLWQSIIRRLLSTASCSNIVDSRAAAVSASFSMWGKWHLLLRDLNKNSPWVPLFYSEKMSTLKIQSGRTGRYELWMKT